MRAVEVRTSSLRRQRVLARLPRLLLLAACGVLALVGVHTALAGPRVQVMESTSSVRDDLQAQAFAESFARAYMSWDAERPQDRESALRGYLADVLDPDAGVSIPGSGSQTVEWTTVTSDVPVGAGVRIVTVAAHTERGTDYLAVSVGRDTRGFLYVASYPALVGGPATTTHAEVVEEREVSDPQLRAVVSRALANYLSRASRNLRADLDRAAVVSLPPEPLRLVSFDRLTRPRPGWVAAEVSTSDAHGAGLTLRYELRMVRRDRWYVRAIGPQPMETSSP